MDRVVRQPRRHGRRRWQPTGAAKTVSANGSITDGGGANPLNGYSLLTATDLDAAVGLAKGCPILSAGGSVEVAEAIDM